MSTSIDNRVVAMQFDNQHFEKNVQTSLSTLDKLKRSLKLDGAAKGLEHVQSTAKKFDMTAMGSAVEGVRVKFSALEVMAVTALSNITNSAINAGKRLVSAFTIDPIRTGMSEYETQLNSVQTILANTQHKGTSLDQVNAALDELNKYADMTIYNFTEMTRNIGTFTAAGVDLEKSVTSIKGIANLAAVSGSTSQQASTAMYQLSQALATGTVKLMDWNSVVNAGMGGKVFQDALTRTAAVMAGASKDVEKWREKNIEAHGSFRDSLTEGGWLTADVLTETLTQLSGAYTKADLLNKGYTEEQAKEILELADTAVNAATKVKTFTQLMDTLKEAAQSGWAQTWEILVGDFEQAKELWTGVSDVLGGFIEKASNNRNELLGGAMTSNWDKLIKKVNEAGIETEAFEEQVKKAAKAHDVDIDALVKKYGSLGEVFKSGAASSNILKDAMKALSGESTKTVKEAETYTVKSGDTLTRIAKKYGTTVEAIAKANGILDVNFIRTGQVLKVSEAITETSKSADLMTESIGDLINNVDQLGGRELLIESFKNIFGTLAKVLGIVKDSFRAMIPQITSEQLYGMIKGFKELTDKFKLSNKRVAQLRYTFKGLFAVLDIVKNIVGPILGAALKGFGNIVGFVTGKILDLTGPIGLAIVKFKKWLDQNNGLAKGFELLKVVFGSISAALKEWIDAFLQIPAVQDAIAKVKGAFSDAFGSMGKFIMGGIDAIKEFIVKFEKLSVLKPSVMWATIFKDFKNTVVSYFSKIDLKGIFTNVTDSVKGFKDGALATFEAVGGKVEWVKEKFLAFVDFIKSKIPAAIAIGLGIGLIKGVSKLGETLSILANPIQGIKDILDSVADGFKTKMKAEAFEARTKGIMNIAIAIGILAASLVALTMVDQKNLWSAVGAISAVIAVLTAASIIAKKVGGIADLSGFAGPILALSGAIAILAYAIKSLVGIPFKEGMASVGVLSAMMIVLVGVVAIMSKFAPKLSTGSLTFVTLALAIAIMVKALKMIDSIEFNHLGQSLLVLGGVVAGLAVLATSTRGIKFGSLAGIIALALGLRMMVGTLEAIADIDTDKILDNIEGMILVFGSVVLLMAATKLAGANGASGGIGVLAMSVAMLLIVKAIKDIADIDKSMISKATDAISQVALVFGAFALLSRFGGKNGLGLGVTILAMSGAILVLVGAIHLLKDIDPSKLDNAMDAIERMILMFGLLVATTGLAQSCTGTLIVLTVAIGVLSVALASLSMIDPDGLKNATTALTVVIGMFALLVGASKLMGKCVGSLTVMTLAIVVLSGLIMMLSELPIEKTLGVAASLSMLILSLSASAAMMALVNPATALQGVAGLAVLITGIAAIMAAIAGLNKLCPEMNEFLSGALPTLELLGKGIGTFFGSIVGGFAEGVSSSFPQIGTDLSNFMTNLQPFIDGAKQIDSSILDGVTSIIDVFAKLTTANLVETITSWITGTSSVDKFASQMSTLIDAVKDFSSSASDITEDAVTKAGIVANVIDAIIGVADKIPETGGLKQAILGAPDLVNFATGISALGPAVKTFMDSITDITDEDSTKMTTIAGSIRSLADLAAAVPETDGLKQAILGAPDLVNFATGISELGPAVKTFTDSVADVTEADSTKMTTIAGSIQSLVDLSKSIPESGGLAQAILGAPDLAKFASEMKTFGDKVSEFVSSTSEVTDTDIAKMTSIATAASTLVDMAASLEAYDDSSWGNTNLTEFAKELKTFGDKMSDFAGSIAEIDLSNTRTVISNTRSLINLASTASEIEGTPLTTLGSQIKTFGSYISSFYDKISDIDTSLMSSVVSSLRSLTNTISKMSDLDTGALSKFDDEMGKVGLEGIKKFISSLKDETPNITTQGRKIIDSFVKAMTSKKPLLITTIRSLITSIVDTLKSSYSSFESAGKHVVSGFGDGISKNTFYAKAKARAMARAAVEAAEAELDINSPSKEFEKVGNFSGMGFVNMLEKYVPVSYRAGAAMAGAARNGLSKAVSKVSDLIFNGIDTQPTIRPVMDLSGVAYGVGAANEMIGGINPSVRARANIGMVSSMMNSNQNGFTNGDVVDAIDKLGRKLGNISGNTYSIGGITYDKGSDVADAIETLVRATLMERRR